MKRILVFVLALFVLFASAACERAPSELVLLGAKSADSAAFSALPAPSFESEDKEEALMTGQKKHLSVLGTEYELTYKETRRSEDLPYTLDVYSCPSENQPSALEASFRRDTGALVSFFPDGTVPAPTGKTLSGEASFRSYAEEILSEYVDVSGWEYSCETFQTLKHKSGGYSGAGSEGFHDEPLEECESHESIYTFAFTRRVSGFLSCESASVGLLPDGQLYWLSVSCLGATEGYEELAVTEEEVCQAAEDAVLSSYEGEVALTGAEAAGCSLFLTSDGTPCFSVGVKLSYEEHDETICSCAESAVLYFALTPGGAIPEGLSE